MTQPFLTISHTQGDYCCSSLNIGLGLCRCARQRTPVITPVSTSPIYPGSYVTIPAYGAGEGGSGGNW